MKKINLMVVAVGFLMAVGLTGPVQAGSHCCGTNCTMSCCGGGQLGKILAHKKLKDGWNFIVTTKSGAKLYAEASGGSISAWQVRENGEVLKTYFRKAETPGNERLWWEPLHGPGLFVEAPSFVFWP